MIFDYLASVVAVDGDEFGLIFRPVIPITIEGPNGTIDVYALVDTGSDSTIFPRFVAERLGIPLHVAPNLKATAFGWTPIELEMGPVRLFLTDGRESCRWTETVGFFDSSGDADEMAVLGHAGFLNYFTATFDGKDGQLTLIPNELLPETTDP
jgi:predicted aspartyl protease